MIKNINKIFPALVLLFCFLILPKKASAIQEINPEIPIASQAAVPEYTMPHPGILPDHPLYKLKVLRDRLLIAMTGDPIKKAGVHLLLADKRFVMTEKLVSKGKMDLAVKTAFRAEHEMTLLVTEITNAAYGGKEIDPLLTERFYQAGAKHRQILDKIIEAADGKDKEDLELVKQFSQTNENRLRSLFAEIKTWSNER